MNSPHKALVISLLCFLPHLAGAKAHSLDVTFSNTARHFESAPPCDTCDAPNSNMTALVRDLRNTVLKEASAEDIAAVSDKMNWGDACDNFVADDEFGKWGNMIMKELKASSTPALIEGADDLMRLCPAYKSLDIEGRRNVWVLIINAMAFYESSCNKDSTAKGPNGRLVGLLQLHKGKEEIYAPACKRGDGNTPSGTFRCGLSMLNSQLERGEPLFSRRSYWDVLRPQARSKKFAKIQKAIRSYPLCK